ncbi:TPA: hypothetical protein DDY56_02745, partial [Candidatus Uhrbacteria bacterium]|nr:hypothetical protein [Candidatus Uhrbacteria bacterium]HAN06172.1 hypothetical protein [Candidatus Uhrbacteria bacterium]HBC39945.1 hypothetical protein [Candidatus Uhrbacteria bacterium]HBJ62510.1 hypothetical protein [Candidatus Uhrbacteria bacterium]
MSPNTRYPDVALAEAATLIKFEAQFRGCLRTAGMPEGFYQRVIDDPIFRRLIVEFASEKMMAKRAQDFANEEVPSTFGYHSGYQAPKPILEQVAILKTHFPELANATWSQKAEQKA